MFGIAGTRVKNGSNFVESIITKAQNNESINMVSDITMSPTYTKHASSAIAKLISLKAPYGIYNIVNTGSVNWYEFTKYLLESLDIPTDKLHPIKSELQNLKMKRPLFTALMNDKLESLGIKMPTWQVALREYLVEKEHLKV